MTIPRLHGNLAKELKDKLEAITPIPTSLVDLIVGYALGSVLALCSSKALFTTEMEPFSFQWNHHELDPNSLLSRSLFLPLKRRHKVLFSFSTLWTIRAYDHFNRLEKVFHPPSQFWSYLRRGNSLISHLHDNWMLCGLRLPRLTKTQRKTQPTVPLPSLLLRTPGDKWRMVASPPDQITQMFWIGNDFERKWLGFLVYCHQRNTFWRLTEELEWISWRVPWVVSGPYSRKNLMSHDQVLFYLLSRLESFDIYAFNFRTQTLHQGIVPSKHSIERWGNACMCFCNSRLWFVFHTVVNRHSKWMSKFQLMSVSLNLFFSDWQVHSLDILPLSTSITEMGLDVFEI